MQTTTVTEKTQDVVMELIPGVTREELSADQDVFSLGLDSINAMTLVMNIQDTFSIKFDSSDIDLENFQTIGSIVDLVVRKQEEQNQN